MKAYKFLSTLAISAIAVVTLLVNTSITFAADNNISTVTVYGIEVPVGHQGPGTGSVKSAPFYHFDNVPVQKSDVLFHTIDNQPAVKTIQVGPGMGSMKSPGLN